MEGKTRADQQEKRMVIKSQETTKTGTLKKKGMEEIQQNVEERKHI